MAQDQPFSSQPISTRTPAEIKRRNAAIRKRNAARKRTARRMQPASPLAERARTWSLRLLLLAFAFACGTLTLWNSVGQRVVPAFGIGCILFLLLMRSPSWGIGLTLLYLSLLGGARRWVVPALGSASVEPLLLVAPFLVIVNFLNLLLTQHLPTNTRLARALLWLLAIMFLEIFNPIQGGLGVGLGGALFTIVPILWYYYGRTLGNEMVLRRLLGAVVGVAILGALYGLYQTYFGLLPVEKEWVELNKANYNALYVTDKVIRVFSFFTSAQEYMQFISIGLVVLWAAFLRGARLALIPIPLLASAIFLSSMRGAVVVTLAACTIVWAVQGRTVAAWVPRLALALVLATGGLYWSLQQVKTEDYSERTQALVSHQVKGLLAPTDTKHNTSTATTHAGMVASGVIEGFRVPIGHGLGATTLAAAKFDKESRDSGTEADLSDTFAGLGFAGGLIYLSVIVFALSSVSQWWRATRSMTSLATLGVMVVHIGHWIHGGSYAATLVVWFLIGGMEHSQQAARLAQKKAAKARAQTEAAPGKPDEAAEEGATPRERAALRNTPRERWQEKQNLLLKSDRRMRR